MRTALNTIAGLAKTVIVLLLGALLAIPLAAQDDEAPRPNGIPTDWSHSHLIFTQGGSVQSQVDSRQDPRVQLQWLRRNSALLQQQWPQVISEERSGTARIRVPELSGDLLPELSSENNIDSDFRGDWNFSLKTAAADTGLAPNMYPAKFSPNPIGAASCTADYVVFGLNQTGTAARANLIGVSNLYVGTTGLCGAVANNGGSGTAPTPAVKWAYNVTQAASNTATITNSVILNLTGTKVAYVVSPAAVGLLAPLQLQILTLGTNAAGSNGAVDAPISLTCGSTTSTATLTCLTLSTTAGHTNSNSSIFVDYANDIGWVGDDAGHLYKISPFFNGAPTLASTTTVGGTCVTATGIMTAPVVDVAMKTLFFGCNDGKLYGYNISGVPAQITGSPLTLATSDTANSLGINAPPIVDATNKVLYVFYGDDAAGTAAGVAQVVYTATPKFAAAATAALTTAGTNTAVFLTTTAGRYPISDGAFSQSYFGVFSTSTSFLYACASNATKNPRGITLQQFQFNASRILSATVNSVNTITATNAPAGSQLCSPLTEFQNGATDRLFLSVPMVPSFLSFDITNNTAGGALTSTTSATAPAGGTSGIIVDGADSSNQASSLYFTSLKKNTCTNVATASPANTGIGSAATAICAYKLTQSGLN